MRRVVVLVLAIAVAGGAIAVVASGSDVASRKPARLRAVQSIRTDIFAPLKRIERTALFPRSCSVATGSCVEGCAMPIAGAVVTPRAASGLCRPTPTQPCFELIAAHPGTSRALFCAAPRAPGLRIEPFRNRPFPHRFKRGR